jgi:O-antigen/teichoic acid export membrane protein
VQSSRTNLEQNTRRQELPSGGSQTRSSASGGPAPHIDLPRRLTLPFFLSSKGDSEGNGRRPNSNGRLRRARLVSDPYLEQRRPSVSALILTEDMVDADTTASSISGNSLLPATRELISALDTAIMAAVRPRAIELRRPAVLTHTLIEDITQRVTLTLPAVARDAEKEDQVDQRKDITATASGAGIAGIGNFMSAALRYITNIAMTHMVSPTVYGAFGEVYTVASLLGWIANSGFSGILTYLLPGYRVKGERDLAGGLVSFTTWITLISGLLIGILFFASAAIVARVFYHDPSYVLPLQEVALLIPALALQQFFCSGLQALKEVKWKVSIEQLGQPLITLVTLVIFYLLGWRMEALSFSAIGGFLCSMLIGQSVFRKLVKRFTGDTQPRYTLRPWIGFAVPLLFGGLVFNIVNTTDILFLSIFVTPAQAGIYIAANRVSNFVPMPLGALNIISLPLMAEYYAKGKHKHLESICKLVTKWSLSLSLPICLCCFVFHDAILGIFGPQYTAGWLVLALLCFGNLVNAGTGAVPQLLSITKRLRVLWIDSILTIILNVGLCFILVPRFNIFGAALGAALTDIIVNVLCTIQVYWIMRLHPYRWDMCKPLLAGGAASVVGILLLRFVHLQPGLERFAILEQLGLIIPFILVYVLVMMLLRFSEEDRIVFNAVLGIFGKQRSTNMVRTSQR